MTWIAKIVGELACQKDSYLNDFQTTVVSCVEVVATKAETKRTNQNKKKHQGFQITTEADGLEGKLWEIECEDSVLFPEGGGQPTDHGSLAMLEDPSNCIPITTVHRHGLRAVIFSPQPLTPGTIITQHVDSLRRMDHMQQHTGQHLLSAVMDTYPNLETLGWGMGPSVVSESSPNLDTPVNMNYVELGRKPNEAEIIEIQDECNKIVTQNRPITVSTSQDAKHESLPADYDREKGIVRVITIDGIDSNPCCGTHLSQTSHIGPIILHHTQPIRGSNTRLYFTCGTRATRLATASIRTTRAVAGILSSGNTPSELAGRATQITIALRDALRAKRKLETEMAGYVAYNAIRENSSWVHRADASLEFLIEVVAAIPPTDMPASLILAAGAGIEGGSVLIVGNDTEKVQSAASKATSEIKTLKGGGKGGRWQGKVQRWEKPDIDVLEAIARGNF